MSHVQLCRTIFGGGPAEAVSTRASRSQQPTEEGAAASRVASESTAVAGIARLMEASRCEVDAEVGVEARDDGGDGRLNPIYDR